MSQSPNLSFLLDENVSHGIKKLLDSKGYEVITVQALHKRRIKNSALLKLARDRRNILVTYDKDFLYLSKTPKDSIILVDIHPLIDENVLPAFEKFLDRIEFSELEGNFIILYENNYKIKKK
ncbi:MAG: DUF5615 family PIN-like protein [Candidatus Helarchaeota archaeon]